MARRGFTLIELLVVIAIIALLIGILMPGLGRARQLGRQVACQAHLRGLVTSQAAYENENKGWLVGPNTSGAALQAGGAYVPGDSTPVQDWDFVSPLVGQSLSFSTDQLGKFEQICQTKLRCPNNNTKYLRRFQGPPLQIEGKGDQPFVLSYMTPAYMQHYPTGVLYVNGKPVEALPSGEPVRLPKGYMPRTDRVTPFPSKKLFAFEGARYYDPSYKGFDYSTVTNATGLGGSPQGNFLSRGGAFQGSGDYYFRDGGNGFKPSDVLRQISLRHFDRMSGGMMDGHVEMFDNAQSANPAMYAPSKTVLANPWATWWYYLGPANSPYKNPDAVLD